MRIREEDCNLILLSVVTLFAVVIAGGASLLDMSAQKPIYLADRAARAEQAPSPSPNKPVVYVADQPPVRVIGSPFVPNTNPRER
jgi:hypothetical protein